MNALFHFAPLLAGLRGQLARALLLSLVTLVAGIALLGVSGWFLTAAALSTAGAAFNLFAPSAGVRGLAFVRILSRYGEKIAGHDATLRLLSDLRRWLFGGLFGAIPLAGAGLSRPELVSRLVADVDALDNAFLTAIGPVTTAVCVGLATSFGLTALLPGAAGGYAVCFFSVAVVVPVVLVAVSRRLGKAAVAAAATLRQHVLDDLDSHQDLVVFGQVDGALRQTRGAAAGLARARRRLGWLGAAAGAISQALAGGATVVVLIAGIAALRDGRLDGPILAGILLAVIASFEAATPLVRGAARLSAAAAAAERLEAMASLKSPIAEAKSPVALPAGGRLELDHIRFGYDPDRPVLRDVSLRIENGQCVAITGLSGAGKSTIAQLLVRLADPQSGAIRLNGVDLLQVSLIELRGSVSLMLQDAPVFNDTIRSNLLIGAPGAADEALWQSLDAVKLGSFVRGLPDGLDTVVGETGATLSTGQSRRLSLARTVLSPAEVLVLDEPTSGLDRETEVAFFAGLRDAAAGRTVLIITHATLPPGSVERVYQLQSGVLEEVH